MKNFTGYSCTSFGSLLGATLLTFFASPNVGTAADCKPITDLPTKPIVSTDGSFPASPPDITISDCRTVAPGTYTSGYINIVAGGTLQFNETQNSVTNFYAKSILVEQGGTLVAGAYNAPFGADGGKLTIGLWGAGPANIASNPTPDYSPIACVGNSGTCYSADTVGKYCTGTDPTDPCNSPSGSDNAYFQGYQPLPYDGTGIFGYKTLAVSYGGSLELFGNKGVEAKYQVEPKPTNACEIPTTDQTDINSWASGSGSSWGRLNGDVKSGSNAPLQLDRDLGLEAGDKLVLSPTDWHPGHHELLEVASYNSGSMQATLTSAPAYDHQGTAYRVAADALSSPTTTPNSQVDVRGAVGLLSRSIIIRSMGSTYDQTTGKPVDFPAAADCGCPGGTCTTNADCFFGGHVIARQGFGKFQVQGVEFYQLGQGSRMAHYPVHFHLAKQTSYTNAFVSDSSIWDSHTRFVVLHGSQNVNIARNVGYLSVGHGYYLEDATEIDNTLCYNLGVAARGPSTDYFAAQDPNSATYRYVPPILAPFGGSGAGGDANTPTMFWMMNTYNDFVGNLASGTHGQGVCYWPLPSSVSGKSGQTGMKWDSTTYANFNVGGTRTSPMKVFRGNSCSTSAYGFMTEFGNIPMPSQGSIVGPAYKKNNPPSVNGSGNYLANYLESGSSDPAPCQAGGHSPGNTQNTTVGCATTLIDRFTTSFNWAQTNFGSVWLRPRDFVFSNSAITDQLHGGLGFVSGGDPSETIPHRLALTQDSIYIGSTAEPMTATPTTRQPSQPLPAGETSATIPVMAPATGWNSPMGPDIGAKSPGADSIVPGSVVFDVLDEGVMYPSNAFDPKRLMTIYDGPFFADGSIFDVQDYECTISTGAVDNSSPSSTCGLYTNTIQPCYPIPTDPTKCETTTVFPNHEYTVRIANAGIGWKQPNLFYYPPAFAFRNTSFAEGSARHNVIDQYAPYVSGGIVSGGAGYEINGMLQSDIANSDGLTSTDFTTILNDLDGTLNGIKRTSGSAESSGLSRNKYYNTPLNVDECNSFGTQTSPDKFVSTYLQGARGGPDLYRQYMVKGETQACDGCDRQLAMATGGITNALTANKGLYYLDTSSMSKSSTYTMAHLFATTEVAVTYQIYVGPTFKTSSDFDWIRVGVHNNYSVTPNPTPIPDPTYDAATGILTVVIDNSQIADSFKFDASDPLICAPQDICQVNQSQDGCTVNASFASNSSMAGLVPQMTEVCENWVTSTHAQTYEDVFLDDCPRGGCLGFSFTLPSDWESKTYAEKGQTLALPYPDAAPWNGTVVSSDKDNCPVPVAEFN